MNSRYALDRLYDFINKPDEENDGEDFEINEIVLPPVSGYNVKIGYCSDEFSLLLSCRNQRPRRFSSNRITIKIENIKVTSHDTAQDLLEKIANSYFFQIDLLFELSLSLHPQRETFLETRRRRNRKRMFIDKTDNLSEPKFEYDSEAISLYWFAKESSNMPLFQFLAYYQSVEFYFPIYSSFEVKQKIQSLIKDPRFNPNKDKDISKIISFIQETGNGKSYLNEKEQLKSTIAACIDNGELKDFFESDENRHTFYAEHKGKYISQKKISLKHESSDLITEVSERIYEIRCRIVHTKASHNEFEILLPYSNEVKKLNFDIELLEYIARKVLISSSRPINI